jgi:hypothetical protein
VRFFVAIAMAVALAPACGEDTRDPVELLQEGLAHALPDDALGPTPPAAAPMPDDPLARDPAQAAMPLAPFHIDASTMFTLTVDGQRRALVKDEVDFDQSGGGAFKTALRRVVEAAPAPTRTVGSEAVYVDGAFYTRDLYGDFVLRDPMREHHVEWRTNALDTLPTLWRLLGPWVVREAASPTSRDGAVLERATLALRPTEAAPAADATPALRDDLATWDRWWRAIHSAQEVRGEVLTDPSCGCVVEARLDATFEGQAEGRAFQLRVDHRFSLTRLSSPPAIAAPSAREPRRARVTHLVSEILGDLLEPPAEEP